MSTDGTWDLICNKLKNLENVEVYGQINNSFHDGIRSLIYDKYKHMACQDDWWCRLDSDEFYIDNPRFFLSGVDKKYHYVKAAKNQYYFTDVDLKKFHENGSDYLNGQCVDTMHYYLCNDAEIRFVRHLNKEWKSDEQWPKLNWSALVFHDYIRLKHFQYRYPEQIDKRLIIRSDVKKETNFFSHEVRNSWTTRLNKDEMIHKEDVVDDFKQSWMDRIVNYKNLNDDRVSMNNIDYNLIIKIPTTKEQIIKKIISILSRGKWNNIY